MKRSGYNYHRRYRAYGRGYNAGREAARRHIQEAQEFSREIGGLDGDVKQYFLSLQGQQLDGIFRQYGQKFGTAAEDYARTTFHRWRNGSTKMGGMVAKRLFSFLPPSMPLQKKYELAENVWRHFGPSSSHSYTVGADADVSSLATVIAKKLDEAVMRYSIPVNIQARFEWLSAGDVRVKEQLLNHFRQMEKTLAVRKIEGELPVLQRQMRDHAASTFRLKSTIQVHKHNICVWVDKHLGTEIREGTPNFVVPTTWFWWVVAAIAALLLLYYLSSGPDFY